jgi:hypothetical protein
MVKDKQAASAAIRIASMQCSFFVMRWTWKGRCGSGTGINVTGISFTRLYLVDPECGTGCTS